MIDARTPEEVARDEYRGKCMLEEHNLRNQNAAVKAAWDNYQLVLKLARRYPELIDD